jgi:hypothetical protein
MNVWALKVMEQLSTKGTASAVPYPRDLMRALAPEVRFLPAILEAPISIGPRPTQGNENATLQQPLSTESSPFPFSSRAKPTCPGAPWRELQFRGSFLQTLNSIPNNIVISPVPWLAVGPERSGVERSAVLSRSDQVSKSEGDVTL